MVGYALMYRLNVVLEEHVVVLLLLKGDHLLLLAHVERAGGGEWGAEWERVGAGPDRALVHARMASDWRRRRHQIQHTALTSQF